MSVMVGPSLPPCRDEGFPVHQDPVHGIGANPGNREWAQRPLSFFVVCPNPVHRVLVNWDPPISQVIDLLGGIQKGNASITTTNAAVDYEYAAETLARVYAQTLTGFTGFIEDF